MTESIIRVQGLTKVFPRAGSALTFFRHMERRVRSGQEEQALFALCDVNFEVLRGEWVGVVGNNGSGKTTLIKVLAGLYPPTTGTVRVAGDVTLLSGLGVGMIGALSVRENVFLYGALHRIPTAQLQTSFAEMIAWAELEDFVDAKFQTLSSGMRGRLAFSVSRYAPSQIMLQDEALTAGDKDFARKCRAYYTTARSGGRTFVIATHDLNFVQEHCARTLWLAKGRQMAFGTTRDVLDQYHAYHA